MPAWVRRLGSVFLIWIMIPYASAQSLNPDVIFEGLGAEVWADKILEEAEKMAPSLEQEATRDKNKSFDQQLAEILFVQPDKDTRDTILSELDANASSFDNPERIKNAVQMLEDFYSKSFRVDTFEVEIIDDWFSQYLALYLYAQLVDQDTAYSVASTLHSMEFLVDQKQDDEMYDFAQAALFHIKAQRNYAKGRLPSYIEYFRQREYWLHKILPDLDNRGEFLLFAGSIHLGHYRDKSTAPILEESLKHERRGHNLQFSTASIHTKYHMMFGDMEKAYQIVKNIKEPEFPVYKQAHKTYIALTSAMTGRKQEAREALNYFKTHRDKYGILRLEMVASTAETLLNAEGNSAARENAKIFFNWMAYSTFYTGARRQGLEDTHAFIRAQQNFNSGQHLNLSSNVLYLGQSVSLEKQSEKEAAQFNLLKAQINTVYENKSRNPSFSVEIQGFSDLLSTAGYGPLGNHEYMHNERTMAFINALKGDNVGSTGFSTETEIITQLGKAIHARNQGDFRTAWKTVIQFDKSNTSLIENIDLYRLHFALLRLSLYASEGHIQNIYEVSLKLLDDPAMMRYSPERTISQIIFYLTNTYEAHKRFTVAKSILELDRRFIDKPAELEFHQLFLGAWLYILSGDLVSGDVLNKLSRSKASDPAQELQSKAIAYTINASTADIFLDKPIIDGSYEAIKSDYLAELSDPLNYYMAFGDYLSADPTNELEIIERAKAWQSRSRARTISMHKLWEHVGSERAFVTAAVSQESLQTARKRQDKFVFQRNIIFLFLALLLPVLAYLLWHRRNALYLTQLGVQKISELERKNQLFEFLLKDISGSLNRSREQTTQTLDTLERSLADPKSLELVDLLHRFLEQWDMDITENILTAKYLSDGPGIDPVKFDFKPYFKDLEHRWDKSAQHEHTTLNLTFSDQPSQIQADSQIISAVLNCFVRDAIRRNSYDIVNIHVVTLNMGEKSRMKVTISDTGNTAISLSDVVKASENTENLMSLFASNDAETSWVSMVVNALFKIGGSYRQILKSEGTDNVLELFFPIQLFQDDIQAANSNLIQHENAQSKGF